ncbi:hypothetical protein M413DRAFT_433719 [Hebeloma cylindrosporum]|uniref:Uncharacterized protein n=1 Tax=Hebeloma cylindrosporum TaxID=76867 RepID=A0A0C2YTI8_HEBCY|nr:hypothetical protein M413DRAFT_433719 [Hebeloma cylindrosporum h7]
MGTHSPSSFSFSPSSQLPAIDEEADSESTDEEHDDRLPDYEEEEVDPFGYNGAINPAAGPASREVKPHEEGEGDDDDDDDLEVFTGAGTYSLSFVNSPWNLFKPTHPGNTTPSSTFLSQRHGQDTAIADTKVNEGTTDPPFKSASDEDAFNFLKDILRGGPSEATMLAPSQNQDLMDALGAIRFEPFITKPSHSAAISPLKKDCLGALDKDDLSYTTLNIMPKQLKAPVFMGNTVTTSSNAINPQVVVAKAARVSKLQEAKKAKLPSVSKSAKGKGKQENLDPTEVFDGMLTKLSKLKVLQGPPSGQTLGPDGLPISTSKQKEAVARSPSILDAVPTKRTSLPPYKPAAGRVFMPVTNAALRPTSGDVVKHIPNDAPKRVNNNVLRHIDSDVLKQVDLKHVDNAVLKHFNNAVQNKDIVSFSTVPRASKSLAATALTDTDINMGDAPTQSFGGSITQNQVLETSSPSPPAANVPIADDHFMSEAASIQRQPDREMRIDDEVDEIKAQVSHMEDIQTIPKASVKPYGYVPSFFIVAPLEFVFGSVFPPIIGHRRTYSEAFSVEERFYGTSPRKKSKRDVPQESDNADPSVASCSAASSVTVLSPFVSVAPSIDIALTSAASMAPTVAHISGKRHFQGDLRGSSGPKRCKVAHDFVPELAFEMELEATTSGFASPTIASGAFKRQTVVRKGTRYRAGGLRGDEGVVVVDGMESKSSRAGPARQVIKNNRYFGCDKRVPPAIEKASVIVVKEPVIVVVAVAISPITTQPQEVMERPQEIEEQRREIIERSFPQMRRNAPPPQPVKPPDELAHAGIFKMLSKFGYMA